MTLPIDPCVVAIKLLVHGEHGLGPKMVQTLDVRLASLVREQHHLAPQLADPRVGRALTEARRIVSGGHDETPPHRAHTTRRDPLARLVDGGEAEEGVGREGASLVRLVDDDRVVELPRGRARDEAHDVRVHLLELDERLGRVVVVGWVLHLDQHAIGVEA